MVTVVIGIDVAKHLKLGGGEGSEDFTCNLNFNVKNLLKCNNYNKGFCNYFALSY